SSDLISQDYRLEWTPWSPGYPLRIPVVDIVEIGAGGGSIVWFDEGGALRIGPKSAGADPGPACYGRGGAEPTITDAMVLAGVLDPAAFLGGRLTIDPELSARAFQPIADRLELSMTETVSGVLRLFGELTVEALKLVSVRRGYDPRDFTLIAYGGGGPIHAGLLANELGVKRLVIPCFPGSFSAWGMLTTRPRLDSSRTLVSSLAETPHEKRDEVFTSMRQEAESTLASHGFQAGAIEHQCAIDCRYHGQEHTVRVPVDAESASEESFANRFHQLHAQHYTFRLDQTPIELVNFRLTSTVPVDRVRQGTARPPHATEPAPSSRTVAFAHGGPQSTAIYQRTELGAGFSARGPAIIEESSSTSVVQSDQHFTIDRFGNIVIDRIQSSGKERPEIGHA
ncbi:MAG: hydantoinase/oxoprolinase family protein, partial [Thermomicrobiales bacterium]|nr:hydantoinase/oxoprolinase family protein [Thermomicrobiales bacterium]